MAAAGQAFGLARAAAGIMWWKVLHGFDCKCHGLSKGERILKISEILTKLQLVIIEKTFGATF